MAKKRGRPAKDQQRPDNKERIVETTIALLKEKGFDAVTVRNICRQSDLSVGVFYHYFRDKDDLLAYFLREPSFEESVLQTAQTDIVGRVCELYMLLIDRYMAQGVDFMKSFYSTSNKSLSAYMGETNGAFEPGTVMARCERELAEAASAGVIKASADVRALGRDICTIVKGCVFEWCLSDGALDIQKTLRRVVGNYLSPYRMEIANVKSGVPR